MANSSATISFMDLENHSGEWAEWRNLILSQLQELKSEQAKIKEVVVGLKIQAGVWGGIAAFLVTLIGYAISLLKGAR